MLKLYQWLNEIAKTHRWLGQFPIQDMCLTGTVENRMENPEFIEFFCNLDQTWYRITKSPDQD